MPGLQSSNRGTSMKKLMILFGGDLTSLSFGQTDSPDSAVASSVLPPARRRCALAPHWAPKQLLCV